MINDELKIMNNFERSINNFIQFIHTTACFVSHHFIILSRENILL